MAKKSKYEKFFERIALNDGDTFSVESPTHYRKCRTCNYSVKESSSHSTSSLSHHLKSHHPNLYSELNESRTEVRHNGRNNRKKKPPPYSIHQRLKCEGSPGPSLQPDILAASCFKFDGSSEVLPLILTDAGNRDEHGDADCKVKPFVGKQDALLNCDNKRKVNGSLSKRIDNAIGAWITSDGLPPSVVDGAGFRHFLKIALPRYKPKSRRTFTRTIIPHHYNILKEKIKSLLKTPKAVSLTTDASSSDSSLSLLTVSCHFLTSQFEPTHVVLGAFSIKGSQSGANVAAIVRDCINEFEISEKVHIMVRDGASTMLKAADLAGVQSTPCFAYLLQLAVNETLANLPGISITESLKTIVRKIRKSDSERSAFIETSLDLDIPPRMLLKNVDVRWNTLYYMVDRFISQKADVEKFLGEHENYPQLSISDWETVSRLRDFLHPLEAIVTKIQSREWASISTVFPLWKVIRNHYCSGAGSADRVQDDLQELRQLFVQTLDRRMTEYVRFAPSAALATLLDSRFKDCYFDHSEAEFYKDLLFREGMNFFKTRQADLEEHAISDDKTQVMISVHPSYTCDKPFDTVDRMFDEFLETSYRSRRSETPQAVNDVQKQLKQECAEYYSLIADYSMPFTSFWSLPSSESRFPLLRELAMKFLSAPATSCDSERLFSSSGIALSDLRESMSHDALSSHTFLKINQQLLRDQLFSD